MGLEVTGRIWFRGGSWAGLLCGGALDRDSMKVRRASREVLGVSRKPCRQRGLEGQSFCEKAEGT